MNGFFARVRLQGTVLVGTLLATIAGVWYTHHTPRTADSETTTEKNLADASLCTPAHTTTTDDDVFFISCGGLF